MFLKIFKHAFTRPMKTIITLMAISVAISLLTGVSYLLFKGIDQGSRAWAMLQSFLFMMPSAIGILDLSALVLVFRSFEKAVATDEAYFTFTIPATEKQQLGARFLAILCWTLIISIVGSISSGIINVCSGNGFGLQMEDITSLINFNANTVLFIVEFIILSIIFELAVLIHVMFIILLKREMSVKLQSRASRVLISLIIFAEIVIFFCIFIFVIINGVYDGVNVFGVHMALWFFIVLIAAFGALSYFLSYRLLRRINLA